MKKSAERARSSKTNSATVDHACVTNAHEIVLARAKTVLVAVVLQLVG